MTRLLVIAAALAGLATAIPVEALLIANGQVAHVIYDEGRGNLACVADSTTGGEARPVVRCG